MTKREICERLMEIRDYANLARGGGLALQTLDDMVEQIAADIKHLLLDIAAPDDHIADVGKMVREEKKPPVLLYEERDEKVPCPVCGEPAYIIKNAPKIYCERCAKTYTRNEEA